MHPLAAASDSSGGFQGPSIDEFFPSVLLFAGTPFEITRITLARFFATILVILLFWLGTRSMKLVPGRFQSVIEMGLDFVRGNVADDILGKKDGRRFLPLLTTVFFMVLFMNLTGIVPGFNIAGTSVIGVPLILAIVAYVTFIYAGLKKHPGTFLRNSLFPPGVPWFLYVIVFPIELVSTFVLRPITLTLRLLMNMVVGHLLLVLFFTATSFFFFESHNLFALFGIGTLAFGFVFTLFEIFVAILQAYVFSLLTAVYVQLALNDEH
ncbi:ATP synthase subunit a [Frondihabitans sp. 762G35]|uniref:F0F1 ATP synthase subunit A n=1 Tax=Frondihabitans sp. 762G35 TaxID=1446794 RepID=UPI000D2018F1|nr:ATP synthase subunit a [Frondihabitans sp. 762G35]